MAGIDQCAPCHEEIAQAFKYAHHTHMGVGRGRECLACHGAHATEYDKHLIAPVAELCLGCHENVKEKVEHAPVRHQAVFTGKRCVACHDPHASDRAMMLRDDLALVCLECHKEPVTAADERTIPAMTAEITGKQFLHGPVQGSDCSLCHDIHGAQHSQLLNTPGPEFMSGEFDIRNYALCFECHTPDLVLQERTTLATQFRDGDKNLHFLHIKKGERRRPCTSCHVIHSGNQPRHIAEAVRFETSEWEMSIGFTVSADGGRCSTGCHEILSYSRTAPVGSQTKK